MSHNVRMNEIGTQIRERSARVADLIERAADVDILDDGALREAIDLLADLRRSVDTCGALLAGSLARRSRRELGVSGMARQNGFLSPEAMIQSITGISRREASTLVQVGTMLDAVQAVDDADRAGQAEQDPAAGWQRPVSDAIRCGDLSPDQAQAILSGLGVPDSAVTDDQLADACREIVADAIIGGRRTSVEQLHRLARSARVGLDSEAVARREREHRDLNRLRVWRRPDGRVDISASLDPEGGTIVLNAIQGALSPRLGGPRFTDQNEAARAQGLLEDPRTTEQLAADVLIDLIRIATEADPGTILGTRRAAVRVIVTERALATRTGHGQLEGSPEQVTLETVDRYACDSGIIGIKFDEYAESVVDVGRKQRLFTARQRIALAVRDGGCLWPDCDRPPSWAEAHHINQWARDNGRTDLADGILLCRHHHLTLHDGRWQVTRQGGDYWLTPPALVDPARRPVRMPSKSTLKRIA